MQSWLLCHDEARVQEPMAETDSLGNANGAAPLRAEHKQG